MTIIVEHMHQYTIANNQKKARLLILHKRMQKDVIGNQPSAWSWEYISHLFKFILLSLMAIRLNMYTACINALITRLSFNTYSSITLFTLMGFYLL